METAGRWDAMCTAVAVVCSNRTTGGTGENLVVSASPDCLVGGDETGGGGGGGGRGGTGGQPGGEVGPENWWALVALALVAATAAGNILVCLAIYWERRLQNVTNYFLMSLAITDLMVAVLVMPLGILTLVRGFFPLPAVYCLAWICLDVLFCTASIMHLCTISVDRYLSLRYPMKFGRNKTRRRVTLKIIFVWLLSIAMSLPLSLMYSKDYNSVLVEGICQIPDPLYKLIGSIVSFYIPLGVMLLTYALTVRLLALQQQNLGGTAAGWSSNWLGTPQGGNLERRYTWRRLLGNKPLPGGGGVPGGSGGSGGGVGGGATGVHSAGSTDTDLTTIDTHELWIPESEPKPYQTSALHQFGQEMLKLSRGLESVATGSNRASKNFLRSPREVETPPPPKPRLRRRASTIGLPVQQEEEPEEPRERRRRVYSYQEPSQGSSRRRSGGQQRRWSSGTSSDEEHGVKLRTVQTSQQQQQQEAEQLLPPPCTCPYFGDSTRRRHGASGGGAAGTSNRSSEAVSSSGDECASSSPATGRSLRRDESQATIVTWESPRFRRGSSFTSSARTSLAPTRSVESSPRKPTLRRSATLRAGRQDMKAIEDAAQAVLLRYSANSGNSSSYLGLPRNMMVKAPHSRNSSVLSRTSSRHGRIIRLEQKATKVLGVVFFTFVILWAPFFVLNMVPSFCAECERNIDKWVFDFVTWLGYASSMVNPIFYTIFNKVFRQAFKKVLLCKYRNQRWKPAKR